MVDALRSMGIEVDSPQATFYIWAPTPGGKGSMEFTVELLEKTGVLVTPGVGFGKYGEGYFRISLTVPDHRLDEAVARIREMSMIKS